MSFPAAPLSFPTWSGIHPRLSYQPKPLQRWYPSADPRIREDDKKSVVAPKYTAPVYLVFPLRVDPIAPYGRSRMTGGVVYSLQDDNVFLI